MSQKYLDELAQLKTELSEYADDYHENEDDDDRTSEFKKTLLAILRKIVGVVHDAERDKVENLPDVVEKAELLLNEAVSLAYEGNSEEQSSDRSLFASLESFAHTEEHPLAKPAKEAEGVFSHRMVKIGLRLMKFMGGLFPSDPSRPLPRPPTAWNNVVRLHPLSTRCARFTTSIPESAAPGDKSRALAVFQARAEVSTGEIEEPTGIFPSPSGKCFVVPAQGGYKARSPYLYTYYAEGQPSDFLEGRSKLLGLADIVTHGAVDDQSGLLFVGDSERVKSYSWWDTEKNAARRNILPVHTLNSKGFKNAIGVLPNGRVARAGKTGLAIWNINDLPTHTKGGGLIGGSIAEDGEDLNTWRDDPEEIERSSGSLPHTTIDFPDVSNVSLWHNHPITHSTILVGTESENCDQYYCRALDLEHNGKCTARYLGHGGTINQFSTSQGDPNVIVTAAADGIARLYDIRSSLPVLSIQAGVSAQNCTSAVVCHPDGIPYIFTSELEEEAITLWDVRSQATVYDLATGNNRVIEGGMFWNETRNELYAATSCSYIDRNGRHMGYEPAQIPIDRDETDSDGDSNMGDGDEGEEEYEDTDQCWPQKAFHNETYFGHTFDSGGHRIYRYSFKTNPDPEIVPPDGGATAGNNARW